MKFEKYHGLGNDFIIFQEKDLIEITDYQELAKKVCHRKFGIGADGMIVVAKSDKAPVFMKFYNKLLKYIWINKIQVYFFIKHQLFYSLKNHVN